MNELTAVQWLKSEIISISESTSENVMYIKLPKYALNKALELEEEQHREKWKNGFDDAHDMIEYFREQGLNIRSKRYEQNKQS